MKLITIVFVLPIVAALSPLNSVVAPVKPLLDKLSNCSPTPPSSSVKCLTLEDLFKDVGKNGETTNNGETTLNGETALSNDDSKLILQRLAGATCYDSQVHTTGLLVEVKTKPSPGQVWGLGLLFVTLISICSLLGVSVMPLMDKSFYNQILTALIGLAVGSLSASSIFHLIPQAFKLTESSSHEEYLSIAMYVWMGIWTFFTVERMLKLIHDCRSVKSTGQKKGSSPVSNQTNSSQPVPSSVDSMVDSCLLADPGTIYDCQQQAIKASFGHTEKPHPSHNHGRTVEFNKEKDSAIATVAWMVIFGDGLHNFIDGLSIGAAFNESVLTGISISLAVLCEEFPHELGDFAVLLNAGMSLRQAMLYNFLSACTCYAGLVVGIVLGEFEASTYIFGFAAGMFLYISLVDMIPEMNEVADEAGKVSVKRALKTFVLQNIGIWTGVIMLYMLARYQDHFDFS